MIFQQRMETPASQAEQARELIEAYLAEEIEDDEGDEGDQAPGEPDPMGDDDPEEWEEGGEDHEPEEEDDSAPRKSRVLAAGATIVIPGGSHYYCRRPWTAVFLTVCFVGGVVLTWSPGWALAGAALIVGTPLIDLVGGQLALTAFNLGQRPTAGTQLLLGLVQATLLVAAALVFNQAAAPYLGN